MGLEDSRLQDIKDLSIKWKTFQGLICSSSSRRRNDDELQSSYCIAAAVAITIIGSVAVKCKKKNYILKCKNFFA